ncbi:hypothetical protein DH2020_018629 [Rehmannia glutinosa]|uniref:Uncharacterized protein n=1 Tax=Rehmannia glutinosa TaxID=99300 RepID=A0ABR0WN19_REHGL
MCKGDEDGRCGEGGERRGHTRKVGGTLHGNNPRRGAQELSRTERLRTYPTATNEVDLSISNLSRSLNLSEAPRARILDTALSLMCFTAPQVYDSVIEFTLRTIVTVLSSSIECKVLRINKEQVLRVGGSISKSDCVNVMEGCADILRKLDGHKGDLCALLLYNVIRVAALAPFSPCAIPSNSSPKMNFNDSSTSALANLVGYLPNEFTYKNGEVPLRAVVMNFPGWFFFASMLLFSNNSPPDSLYSKSIRGSVKPCLMHEQEVTCPAKFIAWILNPMSESNQHLAVDYLVKVSDLWTLKGSSSDKYNEVTRVRKESRRLKLHDKDGVTSHELDSFAVALWLTEFEEMYIKLFGTKMGFSTSNTKGFGMYHNLLFRRIPLGILLVCPNRLNSAGCSLLLHYAATGKFLDIKNSGMSQKRWKYDTQVKWIELYTKAEAIAGCKTVFDITDIAESISYSTFETEEEGLNFVCRLKLQTCDYLLNCIKRLHQIKLDLQMQRDLFTRIIRWRHQGKDVFQNKKDLDCVCDTLNV